MRTQFVLIFVALLSAVSCYPQGRVVNGTATSIEKYPFVVSLRGSTGSHSCGSTIIAPSWILSAAHCVNGVQPSQVSVQFASSQISVNTPNVTKVKRIIVHENYSPGNKYANDIALLELVDELVYNYKTLAPVTLPEQEFEIPQTLKGARGILIGWGYNETCGYVQHTIQEVQLKIYSDVECNERHLNATSCDQICGGVDEGGKGQCSGDSGSPLLYQGNIQLGIVSWSVKPCAAYPYPGVYTKVSHYINWIRKNTDGAV